MAACPRHPRCGLAHPSGSGVCPEGGRPCVAGRDLAPGPGSCLLDFGLNPQPFAAGKQEVRACQRIVMNFFTAKRVLMALGMTVQRQEQTFGAIELGINWRVSAALSFPQAGPSIQPIQPEVLKFDRSAAARSRSMLTAGLPRFREGRPFSCAAVRPPRADAVAVITAAWARSA